MFGSNNEDFSGGLRVTAQINPTSNTNDIYALGGRHQWAGAMPPGYAVKFSFKPDEYAGQLVLGKMPWSGQMVEFPSSNRVTELNRSYFLEMQIQDDPSGVPTITGRLFDREGGAKLLEQSFVDSFSYFAVGKAGIVGYTAGFNPLDVSFDNIHAVPSLVWSGSVSGVWDVNSTANFTGRTTRKFNNGDYVTFDAAGNNTAITIAAGGVAPCGVEFSSAAVTDYSLSGGPIKGAAFLLVSGGDQVTLSSANMYTGGTTIDVGTLVVAALNALPAGGSLTVGSAGTVVLQSGLHGTASAVPEPSTLALLGVGAMGLLGYRWRRRTPAA